MSKFKVIIAGGGPVGLTAAHVLSKAGIDFVVLEGRPQVVEDVGASIVLMPHSIRILAQLGLLDQVRELGHEVMRWSDYNSKGLYSRYWFPDWAVKNHGQCSLMCHRADLVRCLYESLDEADRARVHVDKRVTAVDTNAGDGVVVTCEDGTTYAGDVVLGADGVHSRVRSIMREKALAAGGGADLDAERPFPAAYRTMWCTIPRQWGAFLPGDHHVTHGEGASLQFLNASRRGWLFVYEKLERPTTERVRYTEADMEAFAARHGDLLVGGRMPLRELVGQRTRAGMADLEEGVLGRWSHGGRVVLAGDSCHKYTPNAGQGLNNGIQDVAALVNELRAAVRRAADEDGPGPGEKELAGAFERYQAERAAMTAKEFSVSAHVTRLCAWPNWVYWFVDQWVMPSIPWGSYMQVNWVVAPTIAKGLVLDFLEGEEPFEGAIPWANPIRKPKESR